MRKTDYDEFMISSSRRSGCDVRTLREKGVCRGCGNPSPKMRDADDAERADELGEPALFRSAVAQPCMGSTRFPRIRAPFQESKGE